MIPTPVRRTAAAALAVTAAAGAQAADLGASWRSPPPAAVIVVPAEPVLGVVTGRVVSRVAGPLALARVDAERTDRPSPRQPPGGFVTGPDGRFVLPLGEGLWSVGALAYGTWHRRVAVPVRSGFATDLVIWVP